MMDKDKLILVLNLYVGDVNGSAMHDYINRYGQMMSNIFDDSVKVIIVPTMERINPVMYSVKEMPEMFFQEIDKLAKNVVEGNEIELRTNALRLHSMVSDYKKEQTGIEW